MRIMGVGMENSLNLWASPLAVTYPPDAISAVRPDCPRTPKPGVGHQLTWCL